MTGFATPEQQLHDGPPSPERAMSEKHRHEFSVDAACGVCGVMISEVLISEKERADGNFGSYLRVRDLHTEAREKVAELERHQAEAAKAIREMSDALVNIRDDAYQLARDVVEPGEKRAWTAIAVIANKPVRDNAAAIQRAREGT